MRVSVIIPAYNAADTIAETLESLLAQTYANWEAVVVDDGSTDGTGEVARRYAERDARIRLVTEPQSGESAARNAGIALAEYEWILFLDADDWISPYHLERMTKVLASDPELDAVHCLWARVALDRTLVVEEYEPPTGDLFPTFARRAAFAIHACVVRRSLVDVVGRFDTSLRTSPDWDLWQRIARTGARFGAVREVLAFYRMRPDSASLNSYQILIDGLRVLRQGHSPDPRVPNPHPDHVDGEEPSGVRTQEFYLLCWCAGVVLGSGRDARFLLGAVGADHYPELAPDAVATCIVAAAPLPTCQSPRALDHLWPGIQSHVDAFLVALEKQSLAPDLAQRARMALETMILKQSPTWRAVVERYERTIEEHSRAIRAHEEVIEQQNRTIRAHEEVIEQQGRAIREREQTIESQRVLVEELRKGTLVLDNERAKWQQTADDRASLLATLRSNRWVRVGVRLGVVKELEPPNR